MSATMPAIAPAAAQTKAVAKPLPTRVIADPLTPAKRAQISAYQAVCGFVLEQAVKGQLSAITAFQQAFVDGHLPDNVKTALVVIRGKKKDVCPDRATLYRWLTDFEKFKTGNALALTKKYTGRVRKSYGWEHKAIEGSVNNFV